MVTAATQKRQLAAKAKEEAAAVAKVEAEVEKAKRRAARKEKAWPCTAEDIIRERDERGLSWRQVGTNLNLGSPGQARKAYTELTGKPHHESQPVVKRAARGVNSAGTKTRAVQWDDDSDQDEIIEAVQGKWFEPIGEPGTKNYVPGHYRGSTITVRRDYKGMTMEEEVRVTRIDRFAFDGKHETGPLVMHVCTTEAMRCFRVADIVEVR